MRLLIVTQAVDLDDPILGFFHRWIELFASECVSVEVICLFEGRHALPANVRVHTLGKEKGNRPSFIYALRFLLRVWQLREDYDRVFVHMNAEYLVLAGWFWRLRRVPTGLWYMHKAVSLRLRLAILFVQYVFTASPMSMRIATNKKQVVGHGIPLDEFPLVQMPSAEEPLSLLTVGRIAPIKRTHLLIDALATVVRAGTKAELVVVGSARGKAGQAYLESLKARIATHGLEGQVRFTGAVLHDALPAYLERAHLFLHASDTGSLDKASLEPLAAGVPVITTDAELAGAGCRAIRYTEPSAEAFAAAIIRARGERIWQDMSLRAEARGYVEAKHSLTRLIPRIVATLSS